MNFEEAFIDELEKCSVDIKKALQTGIARGREVGKSVV